MHSLPLQFSSERIELAAAANRLAALGYVTSHGGNLSTRATENIVLITPTKVEKRKITPDDICFVDMDGQTLYAPEHLKPTSEAPFHLRVFEKRKDIRGVVHAHPPILTGFAIAGLDFLARPVLPEPVIEIGPMILVPYAQPGSDALARMFDAALRKSNGFLMENHGALMINEEGPGRALDLLEMMECAAQSVLVALQLNGLKSLSDKDVSDLEHVMRIRGLPMPGEAGVNQSLRDAFQ
ncbi:MAG: class II aldolase/adducin family protein [Clostridia bacterium]|nr:class II aldolase/adducin family protein [Clostridia bacterium]